MTAPPGLGPRLARSWVAFYTRGLPEDAGARRRAELESDIWEQLHDPATARDVLGRCVRGIPADVWWRYRTLLESRGIRERSRGVFSNLKRNWWEALVAATAVLVAVSAVLTPFLVRNLQREHLAFGIAATIIGLASAALLIGGLRAIRRNRPVGSRLIVIGCVPTLMTVVALNPVALLAVAVVAGGLWTGNLAFRTQLPGIDVDATAVLPPQRQTRWYLWIVAGVVLFGVGFAALLLGDLVDGPDNDGLTSTAEGLIYFMWVLSWAAAAATGVIGMTLGLVRLATRHRTRPA